MFKDPCSRVAKSRNRRPHVKHRITQGLPSQGAARVAGMWASEGPATHEPFVPTSWQQAASKYRSKHSRKKKREKKMNIKWHLRHLQGVEDNNQQTFRFSKTFKKLNFA